MMNPMLQQLGQANQQNPINQIKNMMNMVRNSGNPNAMMQTLIGQNPQMRQVMDYVNKCGGNPQQAFYQLAQEKGVDPNGILSMLK